MRVLMLVCRERAPVASASGPLGDKIDEWVATMDASGKRIDGNPLASDVDAVTVRLRDGQRRVETGAYLHTHGELLGYDLLECDNLDDAIEVAAAHPLAVRCVLELRPVAQDA